MQSALDALHEVIETLKDLDLTNKITVESTSVEGGSYNDIFRGIFVGGGKKVAIRRLRSHLHNDPQYVTVCSQFILGLYSCRTIFYRD